MLILTIRTDKPESEIGIFDDNTKIAYLNWEAHRHLAETIHLKLDELLKNKNFQLSMIQGIIFYQGPGSFTGLRIGASVVNALAYSLKLPIINSDGTNWIDKGIKQIIDGNNNLSAVPVYGQPINITKQKK